MLGYLSVDIICSEERTDNVQGQISEHIFAVKLRLLCLLSIGFKNWGISEDIPQFPVLAGNIRPRDAFRAIARERKYLMDYKGLYFEESKGLLAPCIMHTKMPLLVNLTLL